MGTLLDSIRKYLWMYYSMFWKRDKDLMLFGAWFGKKYDDNPKYLYEYILKNRPDIKVVWMTADQAIHDRLESQGMPVCLSSSKEGARLSKRAKYVFTATGRLDIGENNAKFLGGAVYINLWHGIPLKKIMYDDEFSEMRKGSTRKTLKMALEKLPYRKYYILSTSDVITEMYKSAFRVKQKQILQLGQPRNDCFYNGQGNPYTERFKGKKVILYMPTHRNEGKVKLDAAALFDLERLNELCAQYNAVFLIKKHFYHAGEPDVTHKYAAIFDITNEVTETQMLLDAAGILITDYSSCYIDYLLLDRPVVFYNFDAKRYMEEDRKLYFNYEDVAPGCICETYSPLEQELTGLLQGADGHSDDRARVRDLFYCKEAQKAVAGQIVKVVQDL